MPTRSPGVDPGREQAAGERVGVGVQLPRRSSAGRSARRPAPRGRRTRRRPGAGWRRWSRRAAAGTRRRGCRTADFQRHGDPPDIGSHPSCPFMPARCEGCGPRSLPGHDAVRVHGRGYCQRNVHAQSSLPERSWGLDLWLIVAAVLGVAEVVTMTLALGLIAVAAVAAAGVGAVGRERGRSSSARSWWLAGRAGRGPADRAAPHQAAAAAAHRARPRWSAGRRIVIEEVTAHDRAGQHRRRGMVLAPLRRDPGRSRWAPRSTSC